MKKQFASIALLSIAALVAGCDKDKAASDQMDKVKTDTQNAAEDMKNYTYAQKAEFVASMQAQIASINTNLDELETRVAKSSEALQAEAKPKIQALRDQTAQLNQQLDTVKNSTESTWDSTKAGFKKAWDSTKDGFTQARQWVSDKVAP